MFNVATDFNVDYRIDGKLTPVSVRWPTDEEWASYIRKKPNLFRVLSRGRTQPLPSPTEGDLELYQKIQLNGAPPLSGAEAEGLINGVARCEVMSLELGAEEATLVMDTKLGEVKHVLKIPSMDLIRKFQASAEITTRPQNQLIQVRRDADPAGQLWDKCSPKTEGYEGPVPLHHKDVVIRQVIEAVKDESQYGREANF
jgi:hypothetical protein